ncbi:MAG: hypothetical protein KJ057_06425 [Phycisphaerae bacterium]|nr:MAG: hypothetical protein EDS66_03590 [Planctomycetota bacterium]KAB2944974.1 MAG: hypothetical protein F9K17_10585 [Phycisphaerae bacterium]MBE7456741.1 hypothetical protein [Planctomycetia bacterium]MCK6463883.1 hypothetical protein [Phycisphaerae bacterium]MCL4718095.1 hypothetical protein [Phycisphaerae bacterium]
MSQDVSSLPSPTDIPTEAVRDAAEDFFFGLDRTKLIWLGWLVGLLMMLWAARRVLRWVRRRRPVKLHPNLQKYGDATAPSASEDELSAKRHAEAARIVATSSTADIAGYQILQQVEAVYVDGFRRPEDALEGLKAAAAMKGANAVIRVHQERTAAGRCSASGDAVIVRRTENPA